MFDVYLSEMSVSDKHGGGLTLQRILGDDLDKISHFVHVDRFAKDLPVAGKFAEKTIDVLSFWESDLARKIVGRTLAHRLSTHPVIRRSRARKAAKRIAELTAGKTEIKVLVCPQGANAILTLEALKKLKRVRYVSWVMDDHLIYHGNSAWHYPDGMEPVFAAHLRGAEIVFTISPAMQQFYRNRFGVDSTVLFGSAEPCGDETTSVTGNGPGISIGYFGAVAAWQRDALLAVARALPSAGATLDIYSGIPALPEELQTDGVSFKGSLPAQEVLPAMERYHTVLLPISFREKIRNMSEFNIATKMSEYLASGVPILAVGPSYAAMIRYLQDNDAAITVTTEDAKGIHEALALIRDQQRTQQILKNAARLVENEVGAAPMHKVWKLETAAFRNN